MGAMRVSVNISQAGNSWSLMFRTNFTCCIAISGFHARKIKLWFSCVPMNLAGVVLGCFGGKTLNARPEQGT